MKQSDAVYRPALGAASACERENLCRELEENIKDAYRLMAMDNVPEEHKVKEIAI
jgi:hypothetical protein